MLPNGIVYITFRCRPEERARLVSAWKKAEGIVGATQFLKVAANKLAGEEIFDVEDDRQGRKIKGGRKPIVGLVSGATATPAEPYIGDDGVELGLPHVQDFPDAQIGRTCGECGAYRKWYCSEYGIATEPEHPACAGYTDKMGVDALDHARPTIDYF